MRQALRANYRRLALAGSSGFTLIEMLVVLVIIGLIMGLVGPRVLNYLTEARVKAARLQIEALSSSLDLYYLDTGRYPTTSEGLTALVRRPGNMAGWNGPYVKGGIVPEDPWKHDYIYRSPAEGAPYEIISLGSDGREGGTGNAADIKSNAR
ncbi:MAG: type II secretion system major pseudopilin GspG [Pseudolabrys sp.]|jgi:general secretion pathway protein G